MAFQIEYQLLSTEEIMNAVHAAKDEFCRKFPERDWVACMAVGSINYGLATKTSDVDTKLICVPTRKDVLRGKEFTGTFSVGRNECNYHDIRSWVRNLLKGNINFLETVFTSYIVVNPKYMDVWLAFQKERKMIPEYSVADIIRCMTGMATRYLKRVDENKEVDKALYHIMRMFIAIDRFTTRCSSNFEDCFDFSGEHKLTDLLVAVKLGRHPRLSTYEEKRAAAHSIVDGVVKVYEKNVDNYKHIGKFDQVADKLYDITWDAIKIGLEV